MSAKDELSRLLGSMPFCLLEWQIALGGKRGSSGLLLIILPVVFFLLLVMSDAEASTTNASRADDSTVDKFKGCKGVYSGAAAKHLFVSCT